MDKSDKKLILKAILMGVSIYLAAVIITSLFIPIEFQLLITQLLFLILSLVGILILCKGTFANYGFQRPLEVKWLKSILISIILGLVTSMVIFFSGASGNPELKNLSLLEVVLILYILAPLSEEIFTRGLIQSYLTPLKKDSITILNQQVKIPVLFSAIFFSSMHLSLLFAGADMITIVVILVFTFLLGYLSAYLRDKSQSLLPSIIVHSFANIGAGLIFGFVLVLILLLI